MEASSSRSRIGGSPLGQLVSSRRGGIYIAIGAAALAGILLFVFVQKYRDSVNNKNALVPVFVASGFIPHGTPASSIASSNLLQRTSIKRNQTLPGAISDPSQITGTVATRDIAPGQQLQLADFALGNPTLSSYLSGTARAIEIPVDSIHGLQGYVAPGDHVDMLASAGGAVTTIAQNVAVIAVGGGFVVLKVTDKLALALAAAADGAKIWLTMRPAIGAQQTTGVGSRAVG